METCCGILFTWLWFNNCMRKSINKVIFSSEHATHSGAQKPIRMPSVVYNFFCIGHYQSYLDLKSVSALGYGTNWSLV